jgi:hypothetical protein
MRVKSGLVLNEGGWFAGLKQLVAQIKQFTRI